MLVLYHTSHSPCSQKVRLVLQEKNAKFDEVRIDLAKKEQLKPDYPALNPNGVVPTLLDDGVPIVEFERHLRIPRRKISAEPAGSLRHRRARAHARLDALHRGSGGGRYPRAVVQSRIPLPLQGQDQKQFQAQEIDPRPVRKELFQRMGSPKGFSREKRR